MGLRYLSRTCQAVGAIPLLLLGSSTAHAAAPATPATVSTAITVDGTKPGLTFDGVGAISGGGGNYGNGGANQRRTLP
ncbi:hypothetical protein ABZW30_32165 [Kitasatospora sp. NPDC004669]|uniref:hypothetical protein n=1 Tax=Kitasatospora sp. NPDC004669 TaxID=3154555 RepID=UPI0033A5894D